LFQPAGIPPGLSINTNCVEYDYHALHLMSVTAGFMGAGLSTDDDRIIHGTIHHDHTQTNFSFNKILDNHPIVIDGKSRFITLIIPAGTKMLLQLLPTFD
jgi:hypothetical protein